MANAPGSKPTGVGTPELSSADAGAPELKSTGAGAPELIIALDYASAKAADALVSALKGLPVTYKVGFELFIAEGPSIVRSLRKMGAEVFLDLKLHDIPNTVSKAVESAIALDVKYLTLHMAGEREMLIRSQEIIEKTRARTTLLGVTVLTSMNEVLWRDLASRISENGAASSIQTSVLAFAELAKDTGIPGLICSPHELAALRARFSKLKFVTPGIRPSTVIKADVQNPLLRNSNTDDQTRTMSPYDAARLGAHAVVVGRPITQASDPRSVAESIISELGRVL